MGIKAPYPPSPYPLKGPYDYKLFIRVFSDFSGTTEAKSLIASEWGLLSYF